MLFTKKKNGQVTRYYEIAADTMTFSDILLSKLSKLSSRIPDFFLLSYTRSFCRLTGTSRVKFFLSCQTFFSITRMLPSNYCLWKPARVSLLFWVPSLICGVFKCSNWLSILCSPFSILMTDWFLFVWQFFLVLDAYWTDFPVSKPTLLLDPFLLS